MGVLKHLLAYAFGAAVGGAFMNVSSRTGGPISVPPRPPQRRPAADDTGLPIDREMDEDDLVADLYHWMYSYGGEQ